MLFSKLGVVQAPNSEDAARAMLIINDIVAMTLCFIHQRAAYIVLGVTLVISLIFNAVTILSTSLDTRMKLKAGEVVRPNVPALFIEVFGVGAFAVMYAGTMIDSFANHSYYSYWDMDVAFIRAYAGMGGLIAFIVHGVLATKKIMQYLKFRRSSRVRCPHCEQEIPAIGAVALPDEPSPLALEAQAPGPHKLRPSFSANEAGEGEHDSLIMKE